MSDARLIGTWVLENFTLDLPDGTAVEPLGHRPCGRLIYTAGGFMSTHLGPEASPGTGEPPVTMLAYCGRWRVTGDQVCHDVEMSTRPGMAGRPQWRGMTLEGDRLVLTAEGAREGTWPEARRGTGRLRWRRIEGGTP